MAKDRPICGANKSKGGICRMPPVKGRNRCKFHGGMTPRGEDSPHFKTGRYSKDAPTRLRARMEAAEHDPKLLELAGEIALIEARTADLLARVDEQGSGHQQWSDVQAAYSQFRTANVAGDKKEQIAALMKLGDLITKGVSDFAVWDNITDLLERRRRLHDTELKRLGKLNAVVTAAQMMILLGQIVDVIRRNLQNQTCPHCRKSVDLKPVINRVSIDIAALTEQGELPAAL